MREPGRTAGWTGAGGGGTGSRRVWLGETVSWGSAAGALTEGSTAAGCWVLAASPPSTVWYTPSNTRLSETNFTSVLAGWTFTSTALGRVVTWRTQPGNLPTIFWLA